MSLLRPRNYSIIQIIILLIALLIIASLVFYGIFIAQHVARFNKIGSPMTPQQDSIYKTRALASWSPQEFTKESRLFYLCKVWGAAKYISNQGIIANPVDYDTKLLSLIPKVIKSEDKIDFNNLLLNLFDQSKPVSSSSSIKEEDYSLVDFSWMRDSLILETNLKQKLNELITSNQGLGSKYVSLSVNVGSVKQTNEALYDFHIKEETRLLSLFRYWNMIEYFYPSKIYMDQSWDKVLWEAIPGFISANTETEYRRVIYKLGNKLSDSHASYPIASDEHIIGSYRPNFRLAKIENTFVISLIRFKEDNTEGFVKGDIVLKIGNKDVHPLYDSLRQFTGGGNPWSEQRFVCNAMVSSHSPTTPYLVLRGPDTLTITAHNSTISDITRKERKEEMNLKDSDLFKPVSKDVHYINLQHLKVKSLRQYLNQTKDSRGLILDIRGYPPTDLFLDLADAFVPANTLFANLTYADPRYPGMLRIHATSKPVGSDSYFKGTIIVLVDERTESYAEYVTMLLQANPKTITVGSPTSGADGNVSILEFSKGIKVMYSSIGIYYPDMTPTQRSGIRIDYRTLPTIESIQSNRDLPMEKAIQLLTNNGSKN